MESSRIIHIKKDYEIDGRQVRFNFQGEINENINTEMLMQIIEIWILSIKSFSDFKEFALKVKNLFRHFTNKQIRIGVISKNEEKWGISFQNDKVMYLRNGNLLYNNNGNKLSLNCNIQENNFNYASNMLKLVAEEIRPLEFAPMKVSDDEKILYQVYSLFYGMIPTPAQSIFPIQVQLMLFILREICNLNILYNYNFLPSGEEIKSGNLSNLINNFQTFGYFEEKETEVDLEEDIKNIIYKIGFIIRSNMNCNDLEQLSYLITYLYYEKNASIYSPQGQSLEKLFGPEPEQFVKTISREIKRLKNNSQN